MRNAIFSIAAGACALAFASPATAQWAPQPYGNAYGYPYAYGAVHSLQARIDVLQRQIRHLDRRNIISDREARKLRKESRDVERRLRRAARNGLTPREAYSVQNRIQRLEYRMHRDARDGRRYYGNRGTYYGERDRRWSRDRRWRDRND